MMLSSASGTLDAVPSPVAPSAVRRRSLPYNAALDGIRAIAIIAVLIFHVSPSALGGGFVGVDVFFVLSGFLVTSIIIKDLREGRFSMREFYLRRIQRLLPNVVLTVLTVVLLTWCLLPPSTVHQTANHSVWALFNLSNIYVWKFLGGYWGDSAEFSPLTHTWSLGIEEQFYLCFPSFLLLLARFQRTRVRFWVVFATLASFALGLYGSYTYPSATFYLLPTRVWELLLGGIIALYRTPLRESENRWPGSLAVQMRENLGWLGLGVVIMGFAVAGADIPFPGWLALLPTVGTALLLISVADGETAVSRFLSNRFMVETGRASYSLYLWHWPLITIGKIQADLQGLPQFVGALGGCLIAILLAWAAYVYVEQPLRGRGPGRPRRLTMIACGFSFAVLVSGALASRPVVPDPQGRFDVVTFSGKLYNAGPVAPENPTNSISARDVVFPPGPPRTADPWRSGGLVRAYGGGQPRVVVLGSSHAMMYSKVIDEICAKAGISVAFLGADSGTPAFFEARSRHSFSSEKEADEFDEARRNFLRKWHPNVLFVIDRWDEVVRSGAEFQKKLRSFLDEVSPFADRVILVTQVPSLRGGDHINLREMVSAKSHGTALPALKPNAKEKLRRDIASVAEAATAECTKLRVLRPDLSFYNEDGSIRYASGRTFFYVDDDHLSDAGSELVRSLFEKAMSDAQIVPSSGR
jgi:peptidoglycan/LPS O-acetylase OafA/YrhL